MARVWPYLLVGLLAFGAGIFAVRLAGRIASSPGPVINANRFGPPIDGVSLALDVRLGLAPRFSPYPIPRFITYLWNRGDEEVTVSTYPLDYQVTLTDAAGRDPLPRSEEARDYVRRWSRRYLVTLDPGEMVDVETAAYKNPLYGLRPGRYTARMEVLTEDASLPEDEAGPGGDGGMAAPVAAGEVRPGWAHTGRQ